MAEQMARVSPEIELCYETFGDPGDEPVLLVMGLATQMLGWQADFCEELARRGFFVIRFDNRDCGRSTTLTDRSARCSAASETPPPTRSPTWPATRSGCSTRSASTARTSSAPRWAG
jgi:pimeloyl-ACP methyl ester carboxylesterase